MEQPELPQDPSMPGSASFSIEHSRRRRSKGTDLTPKPYKILDRFSVWIIYAMVIAAPWLFGCFDPLAVWIMNWASYALGICLAGKWLVRWKMGYRPPRWDDEDPNEKRARTRRVLTRTLAVLTVLILGYILISALNARATFHLFEQRFEYHECVEWLPHSYDKDATWFIFWEYAGLALFLWASGDWISFAPHESSGSNSSAAY